LALDTGVEGIRDLEVMVADQPSRLDGFLHGVSIENASRLVVVVYSEDVSTWVPWSRTVATTRPATDGWYSLGNLPSGAYYLAVVRDQPRDAIVTPAFLKTLTAASIGVVLEVGRSTVQDILIR
jgi:hypothetical protein